VYAKNRYQSVAEMARELPHNQGALNDIMNGKGTTGLEFAIKLALAGRESLDTICLRDPPQQFFRHGAPPPFTPAELAPQIHEPVAPYQASTKPPRKRR
jgi:hypothetical protein